MTIRDTNLTPFSDSPLTELKLQQKQATSPIILSSKKSGYILQLLGDAGVAAGELEKLKTIYSDFLKQNQYVEVRVRIPEVHSYLDPLAVAEHDCICIALKGDYLKVGAPVQVSFEDPVDTRRGYIINSQNVTGDGSNSRDGDDSDTSDGSNNFLDPADTGTKKDNKPVPVDKGFLGLPFKCEVRAHPGARLKGVRQLLIREAEKIAEAAGWYYGATKKAALIVKSGLREAKEGDNNGNHQTGNAFDFDIEIDDIELGRMESYAFVATMIEYRLLRNKRLGLYLDPKVYKDTKGVVGFYGGSHPHYDLKTKGGTQRWVRFYVNPDDKKPLVSAAGSAKFDNLKLNKLDKEISLKIPKSVRLRIRQLYYGYDPYISKAASRITPKVLGLKDEVQTQKNSWESWKNTPAGKSFVGGINSSNPENQAKSADSITTVASLAWKLSSSGPLKNEEKSPDKDAMKKFNLDAIRLAVTGLHYKVKDQPKEPNEPIEVGAVGIVDNKILMNRPYPTRVTKIPVSINAQKIYFNYWKGKQPPAQVVTSRAAVRQAEAQRVAETLAKRAPVDWGSSKL